MEDTRPRDKLGKLKEDQARIVVARTIDGERRDLNIVVDAKALPVLLATPFISSWPHEVVRGPEK